MESDNVVYKDLEGRTAIVTGGVSGIGRATVERLCQNNVNMGILDVDIDFGYDLQNELNLGGIQIKFSNCDVSNFQQVKESVKEVIRKFGPPSILVNSAGIEYNEEGNLITMSEEYTRRILEVNLIGQVNMLREVVPLMKENGGGRIVNVSSTQALRSDYPGTMYQVTKAGILALARDIAIEYSRDNIRINTVLPGAIATEGMGNVRGDKEFLDKVKAAIPMGRRGNAYEVANLILFLLSDQASYITGGEYVIDGGLTSGFNIQNLGVPKPKVEGDPD